MEARRPSGSRRAERSATDSRWNMCHAGTKNTDPVQIG